MTPRVPISGCSAAHAAAADAYRLACWHSVGGDVATGSRPWHREAERTLQPRGAGSNSSWWNGRGVHTWVPWPQSHRTRVLKYEHRWVCWLTMQVKAQAEGTQRPAAWLACRPAVRLSLRPHGTLARPAGTSHRLFSAQRPVLLAPAAAPTHTGSQDRRCSSGRHDGGAWRCHLRCWQLAAVCGSATGPAARADGPPAPALPPCRRCR